MEGVWYDSRGLEWNPTVESNIETSAEEKLPRAAAEEVDEHYAACEDSRVAKPRDSGSTAGVQEPPRVDGAPPDWVMDMLGGDATDERPQRRALESLAHASRPPAGADHNMKQAGDATVHHKVAGDPTVHHGTATSGGEPEDDGEEHDDFVDLLERDLTHSSFKPAQKQAAAWKMPSRSTCAITNSDIGEDDGDFAEQLALELQHGVAVESPLTKTRQAARRPAKANKHRRPTAAERREQDAKWMACS